MTEMATSPPRQRMIEDMTVRNFTADTQRDYIRGVKKLADFLGRSPALATAEDLRRFQLHLSEQSEQRSRPPTINNTVPALRFFFKVTVDLPDVTKHLVTIAETRRLPVILTPEELEVRIMATARLMIPNILGNPIELRIATDIAVPSRRSAPGVDSLTHRHFAGIANGGEAWRRSALETSTSLSAM
ncbi:MAG: site-specific integrase [bacterium]|nr:site-specific integrase [bacterium]